jgi:hypothetical protein
MKKFLVVLAVATSSFGFGQFDQIEFDHQLDEFTKEMKFRRELSGYAPNNDFKFEPILKKVLTNSLNVDSLIEEQPQLYRIAVNDDWQGPREESAISYLSRLDLTKYKDVTKFNISYDQSFLAEGDYNETIVVTQNSDNVTILVIHVQFETYSNLIYNIITN